MINKIYNIKNNRIRIFPFQTKDHAFMLYNDLPLAYLLTLLIDKLDFHINQFNVEYVFPFYNYVKKLKKDIEDFEEEYFIFYLENYFHSNDYALGFLKEILKKLEKIKIKPNIIIHTLKTPKKEIIKLFNKYSFIILTVRGDLEQFFYDIFYKKKNIEDIDNIIYRDNKGLIKKNNISKVKEDLNNYILGGYYKGYHLKFPKSKDYIISIIDEYNYKTIKNINERWENKDYINYIRNIKEDEIMLSTGRGCKYKCSYCYRGIKYSNIRQISLSTLKKDLDYLDNMGYRYIYFYDDCFITTNLNRLDKIISLLSKYSFSYGIAARYEACTKEILYKISQINISRIQIGLQTISLEINKNTGRNFNKRSFEKTLKYMEKLGINVSLDLILGLPGEGLKGFLHTFKYAIKMKPKSIFINTLFLNPGTELYKQKNKFGIKTINNSISFFKIKKDKKNYFHVPSILSSNTFSRKDINFAKKYVGYYIKKIKDIYIILR